MSGPKRPPSPPKHVPDIQIHIEGVDQIRTAMSEMSKRLSEAFSITARSAVGAVAPMAQLGQTLSELEQLHLEHLRLQPAHPFILEGQFDDEMLERMLGGPSPGGLALEPIASSDPAADHHDTQPGKRAIVFGEIPKGGK